MPLIDVSYFFGDIPVPQLSSIAVTGKLNSIIEQREPEYLRAVLGYPTYKEMLAALATPSPAQKWVDIRDGAEYVDADGRTQKWNGLVRTGNPKRSPIAYFVYYWYLRVEATKATASGESIPDTQNAKPVNPRQKMVTTWNEMVMMSRELYWFMYANQSVYSDWSISDIRVDRSRYKFFETINLLGI